MQKNTWLKVALGLLLLGGLFLSNWQEKSAAQPATWLTSHDEALRVARQTGKPILIDFFADWCGPCHMMDEQVFKTRIFKPQESRWVLLRIDFEKHKQLSLKYGASSLPALLALNSQGKPALGVLGYSNPGSTLEFLQAAYMKATRQPESQGKWDSIRKYVR